MSFDMLNFMKLFFYFFNVFGIALRNNNKCFYYSFFSASEKCNNLLSCLNDQNILLAFLFSDDYYNADIISEVQTGAWRP